MYLLSNIFFKSYFYIYLGLCFKTFFSLLFITFYRYGNFGKKGIFCTNCIFIMMFVNGTKSKQIIQFNEMFSKYTSNYTLLVIIHKQGKRKHKFIYKDNIHFLKLKTESESDGLTFDESDNLYLDAIIQLKYRHEPNIFNIFNILYATRIT